MDFSTYQIEKYKDTYERMYRKQDYKSLRDEVALIRMMIQKVMANCDGNDSLLIATSPLISRMLESTEKLVSSAHKMDVATGKTISEDSLIDFGAEMLALMQEYIPQDNWESVSKKVLELVNKTATPKSE
jgi:transketolase C-terminal domain/subunit